MSGGLMYEHAVSHRLFLLLGDSGLRYLISDKTGRPVLSGTYDAEQWKSIRNGTLQADPDIFQLVFSKTEVISADNQFILIPETFAGSDRIDLFKLSYDADLSNSIIRHCGAEGAAEVCFEMAADQFGFLKDKFPSLELHQEASVLLEWLTKWPFKAEKQHIFLYLNDSALMLFAFAQSAELVLCNQYPYKTLEDLQYTVLFVLEQLGFKGEQTQLILMSENPVWEALEELTEPYFQEVKRQHSEVTAEDLDFLRRYLPLQIRLQT